MRSLEALLNGDKRTLAVEAFRDALATMTPEKRNQIDGGLNKLAIAEAAERADPISPLRNSDSNLTPEVVALRNFGFLSQYTTKRYGLATPAALAMIRAVLGKRIVIEHPQTGLAYVGAGVYLLAGDPASGKSALLNQAARLYEALTEEEPFTGSRVTMAYLVSEISKTFKTGNEVNPCRMNPNAFFWISDEFSGSFNYLIADFGQNGSDDMGRFNLCFDSASALHNSSVKTPVKTYDNCNIMLAGVQPAAYSAKFNPFDSEKVDTGLTGRIGVDWDVDGFDLLEQTNTVEDEAVFEKAMNRLRDLYQSKRYLRATVDPSLDLLGMFREAAAELNAREPSVVAGSAPKRIREALSEAAAMTLLAGVKIEPAAEKPSGWGAIVKKHSMALPCAGTFVIDLDLLKKRITAQAINLHNHYVMSSYLRSNSGAYHDGIMRLLIDSPDGMRREEVISGMKQGRWDYRAIADALDSLVSKGTVYRVVRKSGNVGRPEVKYVHKDHVKKEDAELASTAADLEAKQAQQRRSLS